MPKPVASQVIVITGGSSGIGLATAIEAARRGARVVLAARNRQSLDEAVGSIRAQGGEAIGVPTDVTDAAQVQALAVAAEETFGRIDTWVNNAAVYIQGRVLDLTLDDFREVLETDLIGVINGTRQALRWMLPARSGVIIQISSIVGRRGAPYASPYSAAKTGIEGFCDAVRSETWGSGVQITTLYLPSVDTPIYQHARTCFATKPKPVPPVADPEEAAKKIAELAVEPKPAAFLGLFRHLYLNLGILTPRFADWFLHHTIGFARGDLPADGDNIEAPMTWRRPSIRGGWSGRGIKGFTIREVMRIIPLETLLAAAAIGFLAARALPRRP